VPAEAHIVAAAIARNKPKVSWRKRRRIRDQT
jgi:hypothetical protein